MAKRKLSSGDSEGTGEQRRKKKKKRTPAQIEKDKEDASTDEKARARLSRACVSNDFVEEVLALRGYDASEKGYFERWALLRSLDLVDEERYRRAIYRRPSAVKCRLENIAGPEFVSLCRKVAEASSKAIRRGSMLANIILLKAYDEGLLEREVPVLICEKPVHQAHVNSLFRRCAKNPHAYHVAVETEHADVLPPVRDGEVLTNGIQGALRQRFVAALKAHWKTHFSARVQRYLESTVFLDKRFSKRRERIESTTYTVAWWGDVRLGKWYLVKKKLMEADMDWPVSLRELLSEAKRDVFLTPSLECFRKRLDSGESDDPEDEDDERDGADRGRVPWVDLARCHIAVARAFERREERSFSAAPIFRRGASYISIGEAILDEKIFKRVPFDLSGCVTRLRESRRKRSAAYKKKR